VNGSGTVRPGTREHATELLRGLDELIEALRAGCEEPADAEKLERRQRLLQRATELRQRLTEEIERLPSSSLDHPD
jgi:hypothetical protein